MHIQDDASIDIGLSLESFDQGEHSEPINLLSTQVFVDCLDYDIFLLILEHDTSIPNYSDRSDSTDLDQADPMFTHVTSLGRFFILPHFLSQQPIEVLNPCFTPNTVRVSTLIDIDNNFVLITHLIT